MVRSRFCYSFWTNPPPTSKDELTGSILGAPTKSSGTLTLTPAASRTHIPTPTPAPIALSLYTNANLQRAIKLALELFAKGQKYS